MPLSWQAIASSLSSGRIPKRQAGYGPLQTVADERTGLELLRLPKGFSYTSFSWAGERMDDGNIVPGAADGMGVVKESGDLLTMVRNHELQGRVSLVGNPEYAYDNLDGGTSTLVFNTATGKLEKSWLSLSGTLNNCSGGVTPWGSWLSCEEGCYDPEAADRYNWLRRKHWRAEKAKKKHGWVFEVPAEGIAKPLPLTAMGQFQHEAVAFDPDTGYLYQTEDHKPRAGFYRFIPESASQLSHGGQLQMMRVVGYRDMRREAKSEQKYKVEWVPIADPTRGHNPGSHDQAGVVTQGMDAGGTAFVALEGCFYHQGQVFFTAKMSGPARAGQVFCYCPATETLSIIFESPAHSVFSGPDNLAVSPRGNLVLCEDHVTEVNKASRLLSLLDNGDYFYFCQINPEISGNYLGHDLSAKMPHSEWAGISFSADGRWMFANIYAPGLTLAITGPWQADLA